MNNKANIEKLTEQRAQGDRLAETVLDYLYVAGQTNRETDKNLFALTYRNWLQREGRAA